MRLTRFLAVIRPTCTGLIAPRHPVTIRRAGQQRDGSTKESANTTPCPPPCSPKKLHRKSRSTTASQPDARTVSNPFHFGIPKRPTPPGCTPYKSELVVVNTPESQPERRPSFGATISFLPPWYGREWTKHIEHEEWSIEQRIGGW